MNIPFSINGFYIGTVELSIADSGMGLNVGSCNILLDQEIEGEESQLSLLIQSLPIQTKLNSLSSDEIDLIIEELQAIKLGKV